MRGIPNSLHLRRRQQKTILSRQSDRTRGALDAIVVEFDASVFKKPLQPTPMVQRVTDCRGSRATRGQFFYLRFEPDAQFRDQRFAPGLPQGQPVSGALAATPLLRRTLSVSVAIGAFGLARP